MNNITKTELSTKENKDAEAVKTDLTLDWTGMELEDLQALAQQALVVKLQGQWRKNGIPAEVAVIVTDHKVGTRAVRQVADVNTLVAKMSPEERQALVDKILASMAQ